jgi:Na+/Pi-cotransporter
LQNGTSSPCLGAVTTEPLIDILLAAGLTWAAHSSVAVVLLIMAFAAQGVVPPHAAFALVLGANLGTALNPLLPGRSTPKPCGASSQWTPRWREMDSNFRFRASGDTPHRPRGEAASHRSRLPLLRTARGHNGSVLSEPNP